MSPRPHLDTSERRARVGLRHALAPGAVVRTVAEAADTMTVLHATDPASLFLQARARTTVPSPAAIEQELYVERTVLRQLAMRRTLFVASLASVPVIHAAGSRAISAAERKRTASLFQDAGVATDGLAHLEELEAVGLAAIRARGEAATSELAAVDPRLAERITMSAGKSYQGSIAVASRVFLHLALDARIGRARPLGTWIGGRYRWAPIERWFPDGLPALNVDEARAELVRRWLRTFGPGTRDDVRWWTGWTVAATMAALRAVGAVEVSLDLGATGYVLPTDTESSTEVAGDPWVALLPALDATTMGWQTRDWYLGPHRPMLFDRNGNAGPTVWVDGRVVGGWAQRRTGEVVTRLLEDVGAETTAWIAEEAAALQAWVGPIRVGASFPTPLETELRR